MKTKLALSLIVLALGSSSCGARTQEQEPVQDSQSHWLALCADDADCGDLRCICGVCTQECNTDSTCWQAVGSLNARCDDVSTAVCEGREQESQLCVPDCVDDVCMSAAADARDQQRTRSSGESAAESDRQGSTSTLSGQLIAPDPFEIPECPFVAPVVGTGPAWILEAPSEYTGVATLTAIDGDDLVFTPNEATEQALVLRSIGTRFEPGLSVGLRVELQTFSGDAGAGEYAFAAVWLEGSLLFVLAQNVDVLYQRGQFREPGPFGFTLEVRMQCQEQIDDGCFEDQVQANYAGIFRADDEVTSDGTVARTLAIAGQDYSLWFTGRSVDGSRPTSEVCKTGRSLDFSLVRQ